MIPKPFILGILLFSLLYIRLNNTKGNILSYFILFLIGYFIFFNKEGFDLNEIVSRNVTDDHDRDNDIEIMVMTPNSSGEGPPLKEDHQQYIPELTSTGNNSPIPEISFSGGSGKVVIKINVSKNILPESPVLKDDWPVIYAQMSNET